MPPMCHKNKLEIPQIPQCLKDLTILEKQLIVKFLVFIKIRYLPKTQVKVMNDRIISVRIPDDNIAKRVNTLPRNENNCGIVTVRLKRRMKMKNSHNIGNICPESLFECLDFLVKNHPAYKDIKIKDKEEWMKNYERSIDDGYSDKDKDIEDCSENEQYNRTDFCFCIT